MTAILFIVASMQRKKTKKKFIKVYFLNLYVFWFSHLLFTSYSGLLKKLCKFCDDYQATSYCRICAIFEDIRGNYTEPVIFETLPSPPDKPLKPKLVQTTKSFISLKWNVSLKLFSLSTVM